jgi:hypothetical protein
VAGAETREERASGKPPEENTMPRLSSSGSYGHGLYRTRPDEFRVYWKVDRYYRGSRLRHPNTHSRDTNEVGARRFAKKHGIAFPEVPVTLVDRRYEVIAMFRGSPHLRVITFMNALGMTEEAVTDTLATFARDGVLKKDRGRVRFTTEAVWQVVPGADVLDAINRAWRAKQAPEIPPEALPAPVVRKLLFVLPPSTTAEFCGDCGFRMTSEAAVSCDAGPLFDGDIADLSPVTKRGKIVNAVRHERCRQAEQTT